MKIIYAWEIVSWEQFQEKLKNVVAMDSTTFWRDSERVSMFYEERNRFRFNLNRPFSASYNIFKDGLFLVYIGDGRRNTLQMENYEWVIVNGATIKEIYPKRGGENVEEVLFKFKKGKTQKSVLSFPYNIAHCYSTACFTNEEDLSQVFFVPIPERLNRGNWIQYALTNYPNHKLYIIKQQEPLGVIQETIYLLPEEDMELYSAPEVKEKRTENELPIF